MPRLPTGGVVRQLRRDPTDVGQGVSTGPGDSAVELEVDRDVVVEPVGADRQHSAGHRWRQHNGAPCHSLSWDTIPAPIGAAFFPRRPAGRPRGRPAGTVDRTGPRRVEAKVTSRDCVRPNCRIAIATVRRDVEDTSVCWNVGPTGRHQRHRGLFARIDSKSASIIEWLEGQDDAWRASRYCHRHPQPDLREVYLGLLDLVEENLEDVHPDEEVRTRRNRDHRLLTEAIASRDGKRISRVVARHNAQSFM